MIRPTPRAVGLFTAGIPIAFLVIVFDPALWIVGIVYSLVALVVIAADGLMILRRGAVALTVTEPRRLPVGDHGTVRVVVELPSRSRPTPFTMVLEQTGPADLPVRRSGTTDDGRITIDLPVRSNRRGTIGLEALWLRWRGPLGLVERRWREALDREIDVVPMIRGLRGAALGVMMREAEFGSKVQRQKGEGSEFETLREHAAGLDNRHIDWKRSARHAKLLSKVHRTERNHQIMLAFDTGHLMLEPIEGKTRLDHSIEAGLLLGWISLRSGDLVGDYAFDATVRQFIAPLGGIEHLVRIQHGVAKLAYANQETNFTLGLAELNQRLKKRALVVLFTEFVDTVTAELLVESLGRIANKHAVIFVTMQDPAMTRMIREAPATFDPVARAVVAHDFLRERAIVLERIARLGVHILDVPARDFSSALINKYLLVKQRGEI